MGCFFFNFSHAVSAINGLYVALGSPALTGWTANGGDPCGEGWQGVVCIGSNIDAMYVNYSSDSFSLVELLYFVLLSTHCL
jgi:hypothetical protein